MEKSDQDDIIIDFLEKEILKEKQTRQQLNTVLELLLPNLDHKKRANEESSDLKKVKQLAKLQFDLQTTNSNPTSLTHSYLELKLELLENQNLINTIERVTSNISIETSQINELSETLQEDIEKNRKDAEFLKVDEVKYQKLKEDHRKFEAKLKTMEGVEIDISEFAKDVKELERLKEMGKEWKEKKEEIVGLSTNMEELKQVLRDAQEEFNSLINKSR